MSNIFFRFKSIIFFSLLFFTVFNIFSQESFNQIVIVKENLPEIKKFGRSKDQIFFQCEQTVNENKKNASAGKPIYLEFYTFTCSKESHEDLLSISAHLNIPYDTIASINRLNSSTENLEEKKLVIPAFEGIFIPFNPENAVEILNFKSMEEKNRIPEQTTFLIGNTRFYFFKGDARFSPTARMFFLDSVFTLPLENIKITSGFGMRESPVYHRWKMHNGIDFRAAKGTEVLAVKKGVVSFIKENDPVFGNYVILTHDNDITSVYAHLSKIKVAEGQFVKGGQIIALSGDSGDVTGPHLHFEIRKAGKALDPEKVFGRN